MISVFIAILAFLFSVCTYVIHDRKLKKQESLLNEYQLRALSQGEEEKKKAVIRAKAIKIKGGQRTLYVYNTGNAKARNVIVAMIKDDQVFATRPEMPVTYSELLPDAHREIILHLTEGDDVLTLNFTWDDDFNTNNNETQTIDL